uniref:AFG1/ZapE family ATPase n=1 Tax=Hyphomonas sp. TaxID=87 RepID=UPI0030F4F2DF
MTSVLARYEARIADGVIDADSAQAEAAARLDALARTLANKGKGRWFSKPAPVTGLYLWGGVGRGKSMLMDLFFDAAPVTPKRRVHFHEF